MEPKDKADVMVGFGFIAAATGLWMMVAGAAKLLEIIDKKEEDNNG